MWELDCEEGWVLKNWCFWIVVLEKTLESPLDCKEIQPVHSKGDQSWVFFGRNDAKAETPVLWPPHAKSWLIGKDSDAGRDWGWEEKWMTEDEMAGWHHWLDGQEFEWILGAGDGQGGLVCCNSWVAKSRTRLSDWTELNSVRSAWWVLREYVEFQSCSSSLCIISCLLFSYLQFHSTSNLVSVLFFSQNWFWILNFGFFYLSPGKPSLLTSPVWCGSRLPTDIYCSLMQTL